jgi:hypothetical protein
MNIVNPRIQELIAEKVIADNEDREPSGRLSASKMGWPLQWQMLHHLKVPQKTHDEYTLRKFQRGKDVEERVMKWLAPSPVAMQVPVEYRGVAGIADVVLEYPIEVKSCTNMAFKHRQKEGASRSHMLQAKLYGKALQYDKVGVAYVASDDYRVLCYEVPMDDEVDAIIDRYEAQKAHGTVPVFVAEEKWQAMEDYNPYPDFMKLSEQEIVEKLTSMGVVVPVELPLS